MAVTQRHRTVVNPARRKLSAKQIAAGFGGKRRQSAMKTTRKAARKNKSGPRHKPKSTSSHRPRTKPKAHRTKTKPNLGKIISFSLPKESNTVATTKKNKSRKAKSSYHRKPTKKNTGHRRRTHRNPAMGDIVGLASSAVYTIAGALGSKYLTQMALSSSNTGVMGYFGNFVSAFLLSWGVKAFMKNEKAATAVLSGGILQIVLRLINDYTPYGQYTSSLGMGDYMTQFYVTPQRMRDGLHSADITMQPTMGGGGLAGCCGDDLYGGNSLYGTA